jgi:hypothetical protein
MNGTCDTDATITGLENKDAGYTSDTKNAETFIGSAQVTISQISDKEVMVKIFNITSLTSGDLAKHLPWNNYPTSVVRDPSKAGYAAANNYGNVSQVYSFTLPIDFQRLKK